MGQPLSFNLIRCTDSDLDLEDRNNMDYAN